MKKTLILLFVAFLLKNEVVAQKWAASFGVKRQITATPYPKSRSFFNKYNLYQVGLDRMINKHFGINTSLSYLHFKDANSILQGEYNGNLALRVTNKIASNIFQFRVSPFFYFTKDVFRFSIRPSIGLGFVKTSQTIFSDLQGKSNQEVISEDYSYKTELMPCYGISLNYDYLFSNNWSIGLTLGAEQLSTKKSKHEIISTSEQQLNRFPEVTHNTITELRERTYKQFGYFDFIQIGLEVKKYF